MKLIYKFSELDNSKVKEVGGKNASLGEMKANWILKELRFLMDLPLHLKSTGNLLRRIKSLKISKIPFHL